MARLPRRRGRAPLTRIVMRTSRTRRRLNSLAGVPMMALLACGSAGQPAVPVRQAPKPWHVSPSSDPRSGDGDRVRRVRVGMCESEAERVLGARLQSYHHPVNAIVFTTHPRYGRMEVAFRLSVDRCITDVSDKVAPLS